MMCVQTASGYKEYKAFNNHSKAFQVLLEILMQFALGLPFTFLMPQPLNILDLNRSHMNALDLHPCHQFPYMGNVNSLRFFISATKNRSHS